MFCRIVCCLTNLLLADDLGLLKLINKKTSRNTKKKLYAQHKNRIAPQILTHTALKFSFTYDSQSRYIKRHIFRSLCALSPLPLTIKKQQLKPLRIHAFVCFFRPSHTARLIYAFIALENRGRKLTVYLSRAFISRISKTVQYAIMAQFER